MSTSQLHWSGYSGCQVSPIPIPPSTDSHTPILSVIILAFVKSSGKKPDKRGRASETTPLLPEQDSLEGSLRDKVVSGGGEGGRG